MKLAVVTGAGDGIGAAVCHRLVKSEFKIIGISRSFVGFDCETTCSEETFADSAFHGILLIESCVEEQAVSDRLSRILRRADGVEQLVFVSCAGLIHSGSALLLSESQISEMITVNFLAPVRLVSVVLKKMLLIKSGSIVIVSSNAATKTIEGRAGYAASKAALDTYARILAKEVGSRSIRVNCVAPGVTETKLMRTSTTEEGLREALCASSIKKIAQPSEIASLINFLASDESSHITGEIINIDGGYK